MDTALQTRDPVRRFRPSVELSGMGRRGPVEFVKFKFSSLGGFRTALSQHSSIPDARQILPRRGSTTDVRETLNARHNVTASDAFC